MSAASRASLRSGPTDEWINDGAGNVQDIHKQICSLTRGDHERLGGRAGTVVWFAGLPGARKPNLANTLEVALHRQGRRTYVLDGDNLRRGLNRDAAFSDADRPATSLRGVRRSDAPENGSLSRAMPTRPVRRQVALSRGH
jgi:hypothetical protein